jgi:TPR repeat protein
MGTPVQESDDGEPLTDESSKNGSSKNGSSKDEPSKNESLKNQSARDAPKNVGAARSSRPAQVQEPSWKRKARYRVFEGDVAVVELRSRLALAPERTQEPAIPLPTVSTFAGGLRLIGGVLVAAAAAGVAGYIWGLRLSTKTLEFASASDQAIVQAAVATRSPRLGTVSDQANVPRTPSTGAADLKASSRDPEPPAARTAAIGPVPDDARGVAEKVTSVGAVPLLAPPRAILPSSASRPPVPAADASEIAAKMKMGAGLMAQGDIAAARTMFQRAAEAGEAAGAFALAETYDPVVLRSLHLRGGIAPDPALARSWYEKARDLGSRAAPERIARLTQISR